VKLIRHILEENPTVGSEDVEKQARNTFLFLTYGVIYGVVRKISASIGSVEADEIYDLLEADRDTPAVKLINQSIGLQFKKKLDFKKLNELSKEFAKNPTCQRMLREIVVQHAYMFPVDYKEKQQITESLGISTKGQYLMDMQKPLKI
jgi:hypothetical protein